MIIIIIIITTAVLNFDSKCFLFQNTVQITINEHAIVKLRRYGVSIFKGNENIVISIREITFSGNKNKKKKPNEIKRKYIARDSLIPRYSKTATK